MSLYDQYQKETKTSSGGLYQQFQDEMNPKPSPFSQFVGNVVGGAKTVWNDVFNAPVSVEQSTAQPFTEKTPSVGGDIALTALNTYANTLKDAKDRMNAWSAVAGDQHATTLDKGIAAGTAGMGALQTFFAPIVAASMGAEKVPVLGGVAKGINKIFSAVGTVGADVLEGFANQLNVSQETKDKITPLAKEIGALGAQIVAGKVGGDTFSKLSQKSGQFIDEVNSGLNVARTAVEKGVPQKIPVAGESVAQPVSFFNQYQAEQALPIIQMGVKTETLPVAARSPVDTTKAPAGYTYEPIKPTEAPVSPETPITAPITSEMGKVAPVSETPIVGEKTVTKAASDINQTLVKQGFDALPVEEQSKYTAQSYKEQAESIASEMDTNIENVKAMAVGDKPVPAKINGQILFNAVEAYATKIGDGELLTRLASSPLGKKLSEAGQTLGGHGFNDNPNSAVGAIRAVQESRQTALKTKGVDIAKETAKETASIKSEVAKAVKVSMPKWESFIRSIQCGY